MMGSPGITSGGPPDVVHGVAIRGSTLPSRSRGTVISTGSRSVTTVWTGLHYGCCRCPRRPGRASRSRKTVGDLPSRGLQHAPGRLLRQTASPVSCSPLARARSTDCSSVTSAGNTAGRTSSTASADLMSLIRCYCHDRELHRRPYEPRKFRAVAVSRHGRRRHGPPAAGRRSAEKRPETGGHSTAASRSARAAVVCESAVRPRRRRAVRCTAWRRCPGPRRRVVQVGRV